MQMWKAIPERIVIHLERSIIRNQPPRYCKDIAPIGASFVGFQFCWLNYVATTPYDDCIATLNVGAL
jgi:hypothetical protein